MWFYCDSIPGMGDTFVERDMMMGGGGMGMGGGIMEREVIMDDGMGDVMIQDDIMIDDGF